jgi:MYXO-CTERM domain-containing protein
MLKKLASNIRRAGGAIGIAGALACAAPAQAVVYAGRWDPAFGPAFPDLGWRGEALFFVPDACLALSGLILNTAPCSASSMQILSAEVDFYRVSDPLNPAFQETLNFNVPSGDVTAMQVVANELAGVFGTFGYTRSATLPLAGAPFTDFLLFFEGDVAQLAFVSLGEGHPPSGFSSQAQITFSRLNGPIPVSEPGSLALMLLGLGAIGVIRRRHAAAGSRDFVSA